MDEPQGSAAPNISEYEQTAAENLEALGKLRRRFDLRKIGAKDVLELEKAIQKLPTNEEVAQIMNAVRETMIPAIAKHKQQIRDSFDQVWTEYLVAQKTSGRPFEQMDRTKVRVDRLAVEGDPDRLSARVLFNEERAIDWKVVASPADIAQLEEMAKARIMRCSIPAEEFQQLLLTSMRTLTARLKPDARTVRIIDVYRQITLEKVWQQIATQRNVKVRAIDYPFVSFLYDLDLYKERMDGLPQQEQMIFHTGGQAETTKIGVVLGSAAVNQPYRKFCFLSLR